MASPAKKGKYVKQVDCWGKEEHYAWIKAYSNALIAGHRKGKGLEPTGYALVSEELSKRDIHVNADAIKTHYDKARYLYNAWKWMSNHTGCGFNPSTGTYTSGNPDFWKQFKEKHPKAMRLKSWGYTDDLVQLLKIIYDGNHATGDHAYVGRPKQKQDANVAEASNQPPEVDYTEDEIPRMQPNDFDQYLGEDIGDSQYVPFTSLLREDNQSTPVPLHSPTIPTFVNPSQESADHVSPHQMPPPVSSPQVNPSPVEKPASSRAKRKAGEASEVSTAFHGICDAMCARNAIALRQVNIQADPAAREMALAAKESEEYRRSQALMRRLPEFDVTNPMYTEGLSLMLDEHKRRMWLTMEDDIVYAEAWLRGQWKAMNPPA